MGRGRGIGDAELRDAETWDKGTRGRWNSGTLGDSRTWDAGTRGHDKQTTPEFCTEFAIYNFQWSRGRYYMLESLSVDY